MNCFVQGDIKPISASALTVGLNPTMSASRPHTITVLLFIFRYRPLHSAIIHSEDYTLILVNDHAPGEPNRRFDYIKGMDAPVKCIKYTYSGSKELLVFWGKVPSDASESDI